MHNHNFDKVILFDFFIWTIQDSSRSQSFALYTENYDLYISYFVDSSSLGRLLGLLFGRGEERPSEPPPGVPRPFPAISISGSSSEESTSTNVLDAAIPAEKWNQSVRRGIYIICKR
jgi:hypothetical protein